MLATTDIVASMASVIIFVLGGYLLAGTLGKHAKGSGPKFDAFAGGEELPPERGKYHSGLFVYAALFMAFEVVGLLIASSIATHGSFWPLLLTLSGGFSLFVAMLWFFGTGGAELA